MAVALTRAYQHSFDAHPNFTLALTGGCFNALGDIVAQVAQNTLGEAGQEDRRGYDGARTLRFFCYGLAISPIMGRWNALLERRFPLRSWKKGSMGVMEARSPGQIGERFKDLYRTALLANWKVWPLAQLVNFRYMPLPYRVPFAQSCGVFWTLYLSILNSEEDKKQDREYAMRKMLDS